MCAASQRAREQLRKSEEFARATVDALPQHVAILDDFGTVLATNREWRDFAGPAGGIASRIAEGSNYLAICDAAAGQGRRRCRPSFARARALGDLRAASTPSPSNMPLTTSGQPVWFLARVARFPLPKPVRLVVSHDDITDRKLAEEELNKAKETPSWPTWPRARSWPTPATRFARR